MAEYIRKAELLRRLDLLLEKALEVDCTRDATDGLNEAIDCVEELSPSIYSVAANANGGIM